MRQPILDSLNALTGSCLEALARLAPDPRPRPVRLWARRRPSTVLPVALWIPRGIPVRTWAAASMDFATALEISDRVLGTKGSEARTWFSIEEQDALRAFWTGAFEAAGEGLGLPRPGGSLRLRLAQRIATADADGPKPLTVTIWSALGTVEIDVGARAASWQEDSHAIGSPARA
jgi:hypothetical protein